MSEPTFVSTRGRVYSAAQVRKIVLERLAQKQRRGGLAYPAGWQDRCTAAMTDAWLRRRNGEIPGALARSLWLVALGVTSEPE